MNGRPKTLVLLSPAFPGSEAPVNWVTTQQLFVRTLKAQYPDQKVIVMSLYYPDTISHYEWWGAEVFSFDGTRQRKISRPLFWLKVWRRLNDIRRKNDVIGLFSFWCGECALVASWFSRRYGLKHYCWLCGQDARKSNRLVKLIRPRPDQLIAMSDFLSREFYKNHGIRPSYVIPNGVGPEEFSTHPVATRDIDILGVGTLSRFKRYDLLVGIIDSLKEGMPSIKGIHCGEGEDKERIIAMIAEAGLEDNFSLLGETPHRDVLDYMRRTRVLLHTSDYEGFGVVCLEALYAGAHVISFVRPMDENIPHWHIVGTPEEMLAKARQLLLSPDTDYTRVFPYAMAATVKKVMEFYHTS